MAYSMTFLGLTLAYHNQNCIKENNALNTPLKPCSLTSSARIHKSMEKRVFSLFYLLLVASLIPVRAQQLDSVLIKEGIIQTCRPLIYVADSVAIQASLDSIAVLMTGRWSLRIIEGRGISARKPEKVVELALDRQGQGVIYQDGQLVASIELSVRRLWGMVRFDLKQEGKSIIELSVRKPNGGLLSVCGEKLFITDERTLYAFRRMQ